MIPETIEFQRRDGVPTVNIPHEIVLSEGTGFEWGYMGVGPMELSVNILSQFVTTPEALRLHREFMQEYVARQPYEGGSIPRQEIARWIAAHS